MLVLAIDTALGACSAAVLDARAGMLAAAESTPMVRGHAEALMPLVARVMADAGVSFAAIGRVAVTVGPGSFTGLRVGLAAARGIALAAGRPVVGVTTLAAYAAPLLADDDVTPVIAAIDARHEHVYLQAFAAGGAALAPPRIAPVREALALASSERARIVGDAADLLAAAWPAGAGRPFGVVARDAPEIAWVARLGAAAPESLAPPKPLYLRAPDARPQEAASLPRRR